MVTRDFVGGLAAGLVGGVYLIFAYRIRSSALDDTLGPGGMPRAYGWLMLALAAILCLSGLIKGLRGPGEPGAWHGQGRTILRAAGMLAIGVGYLLVVDTIGYPVAIALLVCAVALYQGAAAGFRLALIGICGALGLWSLFSQVLGVHMPRGALLAAVGL